MIRAASHISKQQTLTYLDFNDCYLIKYSKTKNYPKDYLCILAIDKELSEEDFSGPINNIAEAQKE